MANTKSAIKMIRVSERRRLRNQPVRSEVKTVIKSVRQEIAAGQLEEASSEMRKAASVLDKAVNKGIIHKNAAARRKSRLMKKLAQVEKAAVAR